MPIYEYECKSCQHTLERLQKMSDPALVECPDCGQPTLKKLISASAFRLKGSGWYETDFKTGAKKNGASSEGSAAASKAATSDTTKKQSKPKTETKSSTSSSSAA